MSEIKQKLSSKIEIQRLEKQLLTGYKVVHISIEQIKTEPLTDEDREQMQERIKELKQK